MQATTQTAFLDDVQLTAKRIFDLISPELRLVEEEFERQARSNIQVIAYIGEYLRRSGGKRVRPALTILSNYAVGGNGSNQSSIRMATVMEFLHTATLVHDDVIDKAETRRNRPSINSEFGNQTAVLMGDWLYMSAFETSLAERSLVILDILTAVTRKMTEGELLQLTLLGRTDISEEQYFDVIARKTAYLFSACCEIGAVLGAADADTQSRLRDYGMNLGTAFQLVDDLLDFTGTEEVLGKAAGADLIEGKVSLPLIFLLQRHPEMRADVQTVIAEEGYATVPRARLLDALEQTGALALAKERAVEYAEAARESLNGLNHSPHAQALSTIPNYIVERDR
ncbi:MAG TPA: polyprenyl synthetase family protein [Pyrinomonadaceae bacterium]|jgi:octaprenyl-diphosphate synthase|nr:polyprenyl synthetase family protein [Pyrinomonadaceae bacterium]